MESFFALIRLFSSPERGALQHFAISAHAAKPGANAPRLMSEDNRMWRAGEEKRREMTARHSLGWRRRHLLHPARAGSFDGPKEQFPPETE